jgi:ABC-type lipopolysaccharide export system ATPase subunit
MAHHTLQVDSVIKTFDNKVILSNIFLICKTGEIVGVFGRNGTGKSTLLKIIFGIEKSENKFIKVDDAVLDISFLNKNQISYLPQDNFIPKHLFVKKAIFLFVNHNEIEQFFNDKIIDLIKYKKISVLSGGELRYLEIKLILYSKTKFSLLDEPFKGLSPLLIEKTKELIKSVAKNKGIFITDHDYSNVLEIVTKSYIITNRKSILLNNDRELIEYGYLLDNSFFP